MRLVALALFALFLGSCAYYQPAGDPYWPGPRATGPVYQGQTPQSQPQGPMMRPQPPAMQVPRATTAAGMPPQIMQVTPDAIRQCEAGGGIVKRAGMRGAYYCITPFADGGQPCNDSRQCQGRCLASLEGQSFASAAAPGICQADNNPFGCFAEVQNGQAGPALCVD